MSFDQARAALDAALSDLYSHVASLANAVDALVDKAAQPAAPGSSVDLSDEVSHIQGVVANINDVYARASSALNPDAAPPEPAPLPADAPPPASASTQTEQTTTEGEPPAEQ